MNKNQNREAFQFTCDAFDALRIRVPGRCQLEHDSGVFGIFFVDLDQTGNDLHGYVEQVRRETGCDPLVGSATFGRRIRFTEVERIELHGTAAEIGEELARYAIAHGARPASAVRTLTAY